MIVVQQNAEKMAATTSLVYKFARSLISMGTGNARIITSSAVLVMAIASSIGRAPIHDPATLGSQSLRTG